MRPLICVPAPRRRIVRNDSNDSGADVIQAILSRSPAFDEHTEVSVRPVHGFGWTPSSFLPTLTLTSTQ
jgi:hypothetical protein